MNGGERTYDSTEEMDYGKAERFLVICERSSFD